MSWTAYLPYFVPFGAVALVGVGGYLLSRAAAGWLRARGAPPHSVRGIRIAISLIAIALVAAILFIAFGPLTAISSLTVSAVIGLIITLALQTTIANLIAGFMLLQNRLLRLNDDIQISGIRGTVVQMGLVTTWLRLADGSLTSVSNSTLLSGPMVNRSAGDRLRGEY